MRCVLLTIITRGIEIQYIAETNHQKLPNVKYLLLVISHIAILAVMENAPIVKLDIKQKMKVSTAQDSQVYKVWDLP